MSFRPATGPTGVAAGVGRASPAGTARRQTRSRNRPQPSITLSVCSVQSTSSAGRPDEQVEQPEGVGPDRGRGSCDGATRLPRDLDILCAVHADHALGEQTGERLAQALGGEAHVGQGLGVEAGVEQVQDGVLDAADVLVDRHPVAGDVRVERVGPSFHGSVNRRKYQDESTKVSMVSVSRMAGPPQIGQVVLRNAGLVASGDCAGGQELDVVGGEHRELVDRAPARCRGPGSRRRGWGSPRSAGGRPASRGAGS